MALSAGPIVARARRLGRAAAVTRVRTRVQRRMPAARVAERPAAPTAALGLTGIDLTGLTVLDVGPPDGTVAAAAARAGAASTVAVPDLGEVDGTFDVVVLRDLHGSDDPASTVGRLRERTRTLAIVATPATEWPGHEQRGLIELVPGDVASSATWAPSADGLRELLLAGDFVDVRVAVGPPAYRPRGWKPVHYGLVVRARPWGAGRP